VFVKRYCFEFGNFFGLIYNIYFSIYLLPLHSQNNGSIICAPDYKELLAILTATSNGDVIQ